MRNKDLQKIYDKPANVRLKRFALGVIGIAIAIILVSILLIRLDCMSVRLLLLMRGCAGLLTIIFLIIVGILVYRVNSEYIRQRHRLK